MAYSIAFRTSLERPAWFQEMVLNVKWNLMLVSREDGLQFVNMDEVAL
jgi:hypothetical protein